MARTPAVNVLVAGKYDGKDLERAQRDLNNLKKQTQTIGDKFAGFGQKMQSFGKATSAAGKKMTLGLTLPIVGVGVAASKMAIDFDQSMAKMVGLVGIAADEVDGMRDTVIKLASTYGVTANEAADAMFFITSAGLRGSDAMDVLEASLKASAAGLGDVQVIADLSTSAMNAYGADVLGAAEATDVLTAAVREGKLAPDELAGAMGSVLPIASALGVGFDEVGAAMASMSRTGTNASEAATQIRGILSQVTKETPKGAKALASVGLSYDKIRKVLKNKGLLPMLKLLKNRFGGNTVATAAFFGNVRALTGVMDMLGSGAKTTTEIFGRMSDTTGITDEAFGAMADTAGFKLQQSIESVKNSLIEIGAALAPVVEEIAKFIGELVARFQALSPEQKKMAMLFAAVAAAAGPVLMILGSLITVVGGVITAFAAVSAPVLAVIAAIAAVVAIVVLLWNKSEAFRDGVIKVWEAIKSAVTQAIDRLKQKLAENQDKIDDFKEGLSKVWDFIQKYVIPAVAKFYEVYLSTLIKVIGFVIEKLIDWYSFLWDVGVAAVDVGKKIWNFGSTVAKAIGNAVQFVKELPDKVKSFFRNTKDWLFQAGKDMIQGLLDGAGNLLGKMGEFMLDKLPFWIVEPFKWALGIESPSKVFKGFGENIVEGLIIGMASKKEKIAEQSRTNAQAIIDAAQAVVDGWDTELERLNGIYEKALADFDNFKSGISSSIFGQLDLGAAVDKAKETGGSVVDAITQQASGIGTFAQNMIDLLKTNLSQAAWQAVNALGAERGAGLAQQMLGAQGAETIAGINKVYADVEHMANAVGELSAQKFFGLGVNNAQAEYEGYKKNFGEGGPARKALMNLMDRLADAMARTTTITVNVNKVITETVKRAGGSVAYGAAGGIVNRPTFALIGEAGPEAVIPLDKTRGNEPLPMVSRGSTQGGNVININVNAGIGTNGAEVGRQIVESIKRFERTNGPVFASA